MSNDIQPGRRRREELGDSIFGKHVASSQVCTVVGELTPTGGGRGLHLWVQQDPVGLAGAFDRWLTTGEDAWVTLELPAACLPGAAGAGDAPVEALQIPYPDETFDRLVLAYVLEHVPDDRALVAECHRVLKPGGHLVMVVRQVRPLSLLRPLRRLFGVAALTRGRARAGYTDAALFDTLKDGFDVEEALPFSRFFTQLVDVPVLRSFRSSGIERESAASRDPDDERVLMAYRRALRSISFWYPAAWVASRLDLVLLLSRGHALAVRARRRQWRPRRTPTLKDGRSIAEATINTKIGTAAPF
jgi:SAM-dependent methyltransferase